MSKLSSLSPAWLKFPLALPLLLLMLPMPAQADEIAVWNFNNSDLSISHGAGTLTTNFNLANVLFSFGGTGVNARLGDTAGQSLTLQGGTSLANNGRDLTFSVSTVGFTNIIVSFAAQATSTGFNNNQFQYSADGGATFTTFGGAFGPGISFSTLSFDLSAITVLNNNPNVVFRILFDGASSSTGNNRLDNIVVEGTASMTPVPEPATIALLGTGLATLAGKLRRRRKAIGKN
ncbi:MAG TPA: PEP-CTERM sorting domain-containing protein [Pyrinomonadaceae bacterium]|nr:PEP-CTERM sorting domain-containing protein [Pyrinomonadaceae bacterium]